MSYAEAAAKGPKQSPEEVSRLDKNSFRYGAADLFPLGVSSIYYLHYLSYQKYLPLIRAMLTKDAGSAFHSRAPALPEIERSESSETASLVDADSGRSDYESQKAQTKKDAQHLEHEAEDKAREFGKTASDAAADLKEKAKSGAKKAKSKAKEEGSKLDANRENPVVIANGVILVVGGVALGIAAYKRYSEGTLDWQVATMTAGAVGAFAVADYFGSQ